MGSMTENPIVIDEKQDEDNCPPPNPTTPVSERPNQPPLLMRSRPFETRIELFPIMFMEICFNNL